MQTPQQVGASKPAPLALRAYARRRGTSVESVRRAVKSGRLRISLVMDGGSAKIADPEMADREWAMNTDLTKAPAYVKERSDLVSTTSSSVTPTVTPVTGGAVTPPVVELEEGEGSQGPLTLTEASAREKEWKAKLAELDYKRKSGELVAKDEVRAYKAACEARQVEEYSRIRNAALALPTKLKHQLPHLSHKDILVLDGAVRELLEGLAQPAVNGTAA